jgi:hypothetical protein
LVYRGDEAAYFEKYKEQISSKVSTNIVVFHTQIDNFASFFYSRFQNGEAKSVITYLFKENDNLDKVKNLIKFIIRFLTSGITLPVILLLKPVFFLPLIVLVILRTLIDLDLYGSIKIFISSRNYHKLSIARVPIIAFFIFVGNILDDAGYLKGTYKFYKKNNLSKYQP